MKDDRNLRSPDAADPGPDHDLRGRFAALRREEEQRVPEFASLWRPQQRPSGSRARWLVAAACAVVMLGVVVWQRATQRRPQDLSVASITEWKAPTDFLLETPGSELLRTVPEIGEWPSYTATTPHASPAEARKKTLH